MKEEKFRPKKLTLVVVAFILALVIGNLLVSNTLATSGEQLKRLETRKANLLDQNQRLKARIVKETSLKTLEAKATEYGLVPSSQTLSLSSQPPVARREP